MEPPAIYISLLPSVYVWGKRKGNPPGVVEVVMAESTVPTSVTDKTHLGASETCNNNPPPT